MIKLIIIVVIVFIIYYVFLIIWNTFKSTQQKKIDDNKNTTLFSFDDGDKQQIETKKVNPVSYQKEDPITVIDVDLEFKKIFKKIKETEQKNNKSEGAEPKNNDEKNQKEKETNIQDLNNENKSLYQQLIYQLKLQLKYVTERNEKLEKLLYSSDKEYQEEQEQEQEENTDSVYKSGISVKDFFSGNNIDEIMTKRSKELSSFNM